MIILRSLLALIFLLPANVPLRAASTTQSLNGEWMFSIHGQGQKAVIVPSTFLPVGSATLERTFDVAKRERSMRGLLHFEGIASSSEVWLNGQRLGEFGPYSPFRLEVTEILKGGTNDLRVELNDIDGFPPWNRDWIPAFPRFGGIIRDVFLEWKPPVYIDNAKLDYRLLDQYKRAECAFRVWIANTTSAPKDIVISGSLSNKTYSMPFHMTVKASPGLSNHVLSFQLKGVTLWSPESPDVYDLDVNLVENQNRTDHFAALTGFREFTARGQDFFLNGQRFFLKGVFRHDIYGNEGHTLTLSQMESDIADIKSLGANFVRLGHYAHDRHIIELAARYGLLVSEEPPIFALSQRDSQVVSAAKFSLEGEIRRDWNNPSVVIWFLSNEVGTDLGYMKEMSTFVRGLDDSRLVGIVDNTKWTEKDAPWSKFREAKIDFIAQNAYGSGLDGSYEKLAGILPKDLPYIISEWGGTSDSYASVLREGQYYLDHSNMVLADGPRIAGISFWQYSDIPIPRWSPESVLHWSLTDKYRHPYETYYALKSLYTGRAIPTPRGLRLVSPTEEELPRRITPVEKYRGYEPIDLSKLVNSNHIQEELNAASTLAYPEDLTLGPVAVAGLPFTLEHQVILLSRDQLQVRIPVEKPASEIDFLGQVCFNSLLKKPSLSPPELPFLSELGPQSEFPPPFKAYPYAGDFGQLVGEYVISYEDGETESVPLLNGVHFADYRLFLSLSLIDSVATDTERALVYKADYGTKKYQLRLFSYHPKQPTKRIAYVDFQLKNTDYVPVLAAVTIKEE
jgi:Glycosyl hydrolases family 2, TIM barrel domain/Glycosyl hydrolases family 2/Glycosyl hydrolases family 2, sugar binding domain